MMGRQPDFQSKFFHYHINLEDRIPQDHVLRKMRDRIDFVFDAVKDTYGERGNASVPPTGNP